MPFNIIRDDITKVRADAIVNAANTDLQMGGGVCGAIFRAAGAEKLRNACDKLAPIKTGEAVITPGFNLPAKFIVHTAGPVYNDGFHGEEALLHACYTNSLELASEHKCESVAFPLISSGIYGYPKTEALRVASGAICDFINKHDISVFLVVFDREGFMAGSELFGAVGSYIDENYVDTRLKNEKSRGERYIVDRMAKGHLPGRLNQYEKKRGKPPSADVKSQFIIKERNAEMVFNEARAQYITEPKLFSPETSISTDVQQNEYKGAQPVISTGAQFEDLLGNLDESFSATLLRLIDAKGRSDSEVYRRANIDRRLFSKIRGNADYKPSKPTALALAIALELSLEQTSDLLRRAGFALSRSQKFDVIIEYFINNRNYDVFEINQILFSYDQQLLGS